MLLPPRRAAKIAASLQMFARSAPVRPLVWAATRPRSTSPRGLSRVCTPSTPFRPSRQAGSRRSGGRSDPGAAGRDRACRAGSRPRSRPSRPLVAKPSISTSSWLSVWSFSPEKSAPRRPPTASSSSMKMIAGSCLRAIANRRLMRAAPSPANISTKAAADCAKNCAPDSCATAFASKRLAGAGRAVQQDPLGHLRAELRELLGVAQELDDLLQLGLGLIGAGDVLPRDRLVGGGLDLLGLDARHHFQACATSRRGAPRRTGSSRRWTTGRTIPGSSARRRPRAPSLKQRISAEQF